MSDDAEFDAFLKGEGLLAHKLQSLPQASPSAALDDAILQRARALMAQEARPPAANDPGIATPAPRMAGLSWRWRLPAGIAATVLAGVFAHQAFQASQDMESRVGMPAPEQVLILQPPTVSAPSADMPPPQPEVTAQMSPAPAPRPVQEPQYRSPSPPPPPPPEGAAPVQGGVVADAVSAAPMQREQRVEVTGSAIKRSNVESAAPVTVRQQNELPPAAPAPAPVAAMAPAAAPVAADKKDAQRVRSEEVQREAQKAARDTQLEYGRGVQNRALAAADRAAAWLEQIEQMLSAGEPAQALEQWHKFRQAYPDYPVPQTTAERIKAIQK